MNPRPMDRPTCLLTPAVAFPQSPELAGKCGALERLALFACALGRETALELLEGLAEPQRARARQYARAVVAWDSPSRQAKLAVEFGTRGDADRRLRATMAEAGPALRREMFRLLPSYQRTLFPELSAPSPAAPAAAPPGMLCLASRLVREATR